MDTLRTTFASYLEKGAFQPLCQYHETDIRREGEFAEGKVVRESLCAYDLLDGSHVQHASLDQLPLLYPVLSHEHRRTMRKLKVAGMQVLVHAFG